jgi:hypothetical protein
VFGVGRELARPGLDQVSDLMFGELKGFVDAERADGTGVVGRV